MNFYPMRDGYLIQGLNHLIDYVCDKDCRNLRLLEIGSYTGESTIVFAERFGEVIAIDPFLNNYDPNDAACKHADFSDVYNKFLERTKDFTNIKLIKKKSDDAIEDLKDEKFDIVYIDGMHTYEQVLKDINNYIKIINPGGFISGHDYTPQYWPGVVKAVNETIGIPEKVFQDTSWIKKI